MTPTRVKLMPSSIHQVSVVLLLIVGGLLIATRLWALVAVALAIAAWAAWQARAWMEIGPSEVTIHHWAAGTVRIPRVAIWDVQAGPDLDPGDALTIPAENTRPVSLTLRLNEPVTVGQGQAAQEAVALALVVLDPEKAAAALGVPVTTDPVADDVRTQRRERKRTRRVIYAACVLFPVALALLGALVADGG